MKKIIGLFSFIVVFVTISCNDKTAEVKKEIIVVPASPTVIIKDPPVKSTTVTLDKTGVKVQTKKANVTVKK